MHNYLTVTPAGAYQAINLTLPLFARQTLLNLMRYAKSPALEETDLSSFVSCEVPEAAATILYQLQSLHLVQAEHSPSSVLEGSLEYLLPTILSELSSTGKALLADSNGLLLGVSQFSAELADELSALSGSVMALQRRHSEFLAEHMKQKNNAWGVLSPSGDSQLGFWPLQIGSAQFVLVIADVPRLNSQVFRDLVWLLNYRYNVA